MPTVNVHTYPVQGHIIIFRIMKYGVMASGFGSASASREYPWPYLVSLEPLVDQQGNLWIPELHQDRGLCQNDVNLNYRYINRGNAQQYM